MPTTTTKIIPQGFSYYLLVENRSDATTPDTSEPLTVRGVSTALFEPIVVGDVTPGAPGTEPTFAPNAATGRALKIKPKVNVGQAQLVTSFTVDAPGVDGTKELTVSIRIDTPPENLENIAEVASYGPFGPPPSQP